MKIINLYGGPGTGKSTMRAEIFAAMKWLGLKVEEVDEYAKQLCYDNRLSNIEQEYIFVKQLRKITIKQDKVDYLVSDSPLILGLAYCNETVSKHLKDYIKEKHKSFDNVNIFLQRVKPYQQYGREQSEQEAREKDIEIEQMLISNNELFVKFKAEKDSVESILKYVLSL